MSKEYEVEIKEVLSRIEKIEAGSLGEAIDKAMEKDNPKRVTEGVEEEENYHGVELFTE